MAYVACYHIAQQQIVRCDALPLSVSPQWRLIAAGLGTDNLIKVECDATGCMLPAALDQALAAAKKEGKVSFPVPLTTYFALVGMLSTDLAVLNITNAGTPLVYPGPPITHAYRGRFLSFS